MIFKAVVLNILLRSLLFVLCNYETNCIIVTAGYHWSDHTMLFNTLFLLDPKSSFLCLSVVTRQSLYWNVCLNSIIKKIKFNGRISIRYHFWYHSLLEEGGTIFTFEGARKKCLLKVSLTVHNPQFYWKAWILSFR